ncbi:hypothetical protein BROUX41_003961 [Berkeleyomyces rouxiae]|uniref:uncharacterized protein n=1 Tax=Berkeleyomyces rouxiae TaxID=2035830 RepID=UPI003B76115C
MPLWRERGVVPDSEDEESGSDGLGTVSPVPPPALPAVLPPPTNQTTNIETFPQGSIEPNIWDIPDSSESTRPAYRLPVPPAVDISSEIGVIPLRSASSSPLSWLSETPSIQNSPPNSGPEETDTYREPSESQLSLRSLNIALGPRSPLPSQQLNGADIVQSERTESTGFSSLPPLDSQGSQYPVQLPVLSTSQPELQSLHQASSPSLQETPQASRGSPQAKSPAVPYATEELLTDTTVQELLQFQNEPPRRTFRPRKPIQQHPYLLEIASYNQQLKSHGVKPLRIAQSSQDSRKRRDEHDSQDKEFEDDSQEARLPEDDMENILLGAEELSLLISPSTKSKSKKNEQRQTQRTPHSVTPKPGILLPTASQDSDDLPSLEDLIFSRTPRNGKRPSSPGTVRQNQKRMRAPNPSNGSPHSVNLGNTNQMDHDNNRPGGSRSNNFSEAFLSSSPPINTSIRRRLRPSQPSRSPQKVLAVHSKPGNSTSVRITDLSPFDGFFNDSNESNDEDEPQLRPQSTSKNPTKSGPKPTSIVITSSPVIGPLTDANSAGRDGAGSTRIRRFGNWDLLEGSPAVNIEELYHDQEDNEQEEDGSQAEEDAEDEASQGQSDSDEDLDAALKKFGRRLRGVLPPSYLRLADELEKQKRSQAARTAKAAESTHRRPTSPKRGVAQTRIGTLRDHDSFLQSLQESDDEDSQPTAVPLDPKPNYIQTHLSLDPIDVDDLHGHGDSASRHGMDSSDMEEDIIDRMMSASRKRPLTMAQPSGSASKKRQKTASKSAKLVPRNQPSITSHFSSSHIRGASASKSSTGHKPSTSHISSSKAKLSSSSRPKGNKNYRSSKPRRKRLPLPPPKLGILDTVEPNAPRFVRLAVRNSKIAVGDGRSSPNRKVFQLANHWDNRDVNNVINKWKEGRIKQRDLPKLRQCSRRSASSRSATARLSNGLSTSRTDLWDSLDSMDNSPVLQSPITPALDLETTKQIQNPDDIEKFDATENAPNRTADQRIKPTHPGVFISKPNVALRRARLAPVPLPQHNVFASQRNHYDNRFKAATFHAGKSILDELYERTKKQAPLAPPLMTSAIPDPRPSTLHQSESILLSAEDEEMFDLDLGVAAKTVTKTRRKVRKQFKPHQVDVLAPQFRTSIDPPPVMIIEDDTPPVATNKTASEKLKLTELGSFGTQYTTHFSIFPLNSNVSFHADTLLGKGLVDKATERHDGEYMRQGKSTVSFLFGEISLHWSSWNDNVSSEIGVLLDSILDNLNGPSEENPMPDFVIVEAADFVLKYIQNAITLEDLTADMSFSSRFLYVFGSFRSRLENIQIKAARRPLVVQVLTRLLVALFTAHHICKSLPSLLSDAMNIGMILINLSKTTISVLLEFGLQPLHEFYVNSQRETAVQRAIPVREAQLHTWVVLMRILEVANIPRMSFWDVLYTVLIQPQDLQGTAASRFENLWETMFCLLPLREFDSFGILVPGIRRARSMDGWGLPQKLIRRVLQIYKDGSTLQSPSFNEYCRALVGRCHHLIEEWGWIKCNGIIGVIFDFFGSQNLSHLRNEEVFKSPRFLEELCQNPSLSVETSDRCFHIFLKLVALAIKRLDEKGMMNEVRNLIARIMPNHNRQFLKDQNLRHQDLASLRNHHDLLCTIFWAAPPDLRPNAQLIAKLVAPSESHKEACLVNLRAWNQLARFLAVTNQDPKVFRTFMSWQNNVFRQLLDQFESVASDMQAQLLALPEGTSQGINQAKIDMFVSLNRAAIKDMLFFSVKASQDIMKYSKTREAAVFALNTYQMNEILRQFTYSPSVLDWSILGATLETLRMFLDRSRSGSGDSSADEARRSDAVLLQRELANNLFAATRTTLTERDLPKLSSQRSETDRSLCIEKLVLLCARVTNFLSRIGVMKVSDVFSKNQWSLFEGDLHRMWVVQRKYVPLYVATQAGELPEDIEPSATSLLDLWAMSISKPQEFVVYEHLLASELLRRSKPYLPQEAVALAVHASYSTLQRLFEFLLSWMRTSLRNSTASKRKAMVTSFASTLRLTMDQVKFDLQSLSTSDSNAHQSYILFVRQIINLIRSYATDICAVDTFFYQISKDYSPPLQDPKLHVAGMVSYGLRLGDGDARVVPQLFHYLYNNFKIALMNNNTHKESSMIRRGMKHVEIRTFVLTKILPAIIKAMLSSPYAFFLLNVYINATISLYGKPAVPDDLSLEDLKNVVYLLGFIQSVLYDLIRSNTIDVSYYVVHSIVLCIRLVYTLWPMVRIHAFESDSKSVLDLAMQFLGRITRVLRVMEPCIPGWLSLGRIDVQQIASGIDPTWRDKPRSETDINVLSFASIIETDVKRSWEVHGGRLIIRGAGASRPGTTPVGYPMPLLPLALTLETLGAELGRWNYEWTATVTPELHEKEIIRDLLDVFPDLVL